MVKSKFSFLSCVSRVKDKLVSAFRKIVPRSNRELDFERFSDAYGPRSSEFSYTHTPSTAYHLGNAALRTTSGNFVQHYDPTSDLCWPEPVDSPPRSNVYQHQDFRCAGARYQDGSSVARDSSQSWETVDESSDSVMSSLLGGLPEPPNRTPRIRIRRRHGKDKLRVADQQDDVEQSQADVATDTSDLAPGIEVRQQAHTPYRSHDPQPSVSQAVQVSVFTPSAQEGSLGSPGPTVRDSGASVMRGSQDWPGPATQEMESSAVSSNRANSPRPSLMSLIDRPPPGLRESDNFALGSNTLPDPFTAIAGPAATITAPQATGGHQLWSEFSSSTDSRPSPVYLGNGRYRLHDGTVHRIISDRGRQSQRDPSHVGVGALQSDDTEPSSDEANEADTSDHYSGENDESSPLSPGIAFTHLDDAVRNLEIVASPNSRGAMQELAGAVDTVVLVVDGLIHDMEDHARNAQELQRRVDFLERELEAAQRVIQERDRTILRLRHASFDGENTTPPTYSSDVQENESSIMRTPSEPQTSIRNPNHVTTQSSPTPGANVAERWANEISHFSDDSDGDEQTAEFRPRSDSAHEPDTISGRLTSEEAGAGLAPPLFCNSRETLTNSPTLVPETRVQESPPSDAAESDNTMLTRTPRYRHRSL